MIRAQSFVQTGAQPGQYPSGVVGDAVQAADGSVTGTDNSDAHRADALTALAQGKDLYIGRGDYIWTKSILRTGEAVDDFNIVGEPGGTRIFCKFSGQSNSFQCLVFDGTFQVDGITTTPSFYLTAPVAATSRVLPVNTSVGIEVGKPIMLVDMANPILQYLTDDPGADGSPVTKKGQVTKVIATDNEPVQTYTIASSSLDGDGKCIVILTTNANFGVNQIVKLTGLTGTGVFADFEGSAQLTIVTTGGTTVSFAVPLDQDAFTFTGGTLTFGSLAPNTVMIGPAAEFAYSGTPTLISTHTVQPAGTYDPVTGLVAITLGTAGTFGINQIITLTGLTGTGAFASLNGAWTTTTGTTGTTVNLVGPIGLAATTISGGTLNYGSPQTTSTCIRRLTSAPKRVGVRGIKFDYDRKDLNAPTQARILFRACDEPVWSDCEFWGPGTGVAIDSGTFNWCSKNNLSSELGPSSYAISLSTGAYLGRVYDMIADSGRHVINTTAGLTTCGTAQIDVWNSVAYDFWYTPWTDHPGVRGLRFHNCGAVGGRTLQASAFQLRGLDEEINNCWGSGFEFGITIAFSDGAKVTGGNFIGNRFGTRILHSVNTWIDGTRYKNNSQAHILIDNVVDISPYATPFANLRLTNIQVEGVPAIADVVYGLRNGNFPPVYHDTWRVSDVKAFDRAVKYIVGQPKTYVPTIYPFSGRFAFGSEILFAAFNVTPGLPATYELNSVNAVVPATLPTTGRIFGTRYVFKAVKPGANAITIVGTVDGVASPTMVDKQTMAVVDRQQQFPVASGTYANGSGVTVLALTEAQPIIGAGSTVVVSGMTGGAAALNGTYTTIVNTTGKTVRYQVGSGGLGTITTGFAGGTVTIGDYEETT